MGISLIPKNYLTRGRFNTRAAASQMRLGIQLGFSGLIGFMIGATDDFMVSTLLSVRDFAIYRNGTMEIPIIGTLYTSIASIVLPSVVKLYSAGSFDEIVRLKRRLITSTAAVIYPVVFFLVIFSRVLVTAYFSPRYADTASVFAIMSCILLLRVNDYEDILLSSSRSRVLVIIEAAAFIFNIGMAWTMIQHFGYLGAAVSTLLTYLLTLVALFYISARLVGKSWTDFLDFKKLALIIGVSVSLPVLLRLTMNGTERVALVLVCGGISVLLAYLIFLKAGVINYQDVSSLVNKLPGIGAPIDRLCTRLFTQQIPDHDVKF